MLHGVAQGGKFGPAFLSASFSAIASHSIGVGGTKKTAGPSFAQHLGRGATAAIVGGTASVIGGGKFANGAVTGAFVYAFNHARHKAGNKSFRKACIEAGGGCSFSVSENPNANGSAPWYEIESLSTVEQYSDLIDSISVDVGVDGRLLKSIMFVETTHGYYDAPLAWLDLNKSILPMNVNTSYWGDTFGSRATLSTAAGNIRGGAMMIRSIVNNLPQGSTIAQAATIYNNSNATKVNNYGARVERVYNSARWR